MPSDVRPAPRTASAPRPASGNAAYQVCIHPDCAATYDVGQVLATCPACSGLLDVAYDWSAQPIPKSLAEFTGRACVTPRGPGGPADFSGVWRFRELLPFANAQQALTLGEGRTLLYQADGLGRELGMKPGRLFFQHEGANPSGSFKDNGMTAAFTLARRIGRSRVACASTGNTSASLALYAAAAADHGTPMQSVVFVGSGKIALGKLAQALDHGALTLQIEGDFDACLARLSDAAAQLGLYVMNSINPFRLEGQKSIIYRVLEGLGGQVPDWIIVPAGNLGNTSAFGKALMELRALGLIDRLPRIAAINAAGADTLYQLVEQRGLRWNGGRYDRALIDAFYREREALGRRADTVATAIQIARPVNLPKALRTLDATAGLVRSVHDDDILEHKALLGRFGLGCEPASAAAPAGLRQLVRAGLISPDDRVVCILTGHALKDPDASVRYHSAPAVPNQRRFVNRPLRVADDVEAICRAINAAVASFTSEAERR